MGKAALAGLVALSLFTTPALADGVDRGVDGVLGGLAGGLILGPVGLIAGAITGVTAGPAISRAWGLDRSSAGRKRASRGSR